MCGLNNIGFLKNNTREIISFIYIKKFARGGE